MSDRDIPFPGDDASRGQRPLSADWSVAASHFVGSAALGDNVPMLDEVWDGCALVKVDLSGLWRDPPDMGPPGRG